MTKLCLAFQSVILRDLVWCAFFGGGVSMRIRFFDRCDLSFTGLCLRVLGLSGLFSLVGAGALWWIA